MASACGFKARYSPRFVTICTSAGTRLHCAAAVSLSVFGHSDHGLERDWKRRKSAARAWFETLRDRIVAAFEAIEDALPAGAPLADQPRRPVRAHAMEPHRPQRRARRRRRHGDDARAACSRRSACTSRPCSANSRRNSARTFPAPPTIRASSPPAFRSSPTCTTRTCRRCT